MDDDTKSLLFYVGCIFGLIVLIYILINASQTTTSSGPIVQEFTDTIQMYVATSSNS